MGQSRMHFFMSRNTAHVDLLLSREERQDFVV